MNTNKKLKKQAKNLKKSFLETILFFAILTAVYSNKQLSKTTGDHEQHHGVVDFIFGGFVHLRHQKPTTGGGT